LKLLLFDIDGTLVRTAGAGRKSMERSFKKIYGIENGFENIYMMGRTDPSIFQEALDNHGVQWDEGQAEAFKKEYFDILRVEIEVPRPGKRLCPGISRILSEAEQRPDLVLGLLTGNWKTSAYIKLEHFGMDTFFPFGAFGDDSALREELVPFALKRFQEYSPSILQNEDVYIIGDTPADIHCARPYGARTIAVATGFHSTEELAPENPDYLFENLGNVREILELF
jgi:phosphoglycolate phosphatase